MVKKQADAKIDRSLLRELGSTGLSKWSGLGQTLTEEPLRELQGAKGRKLFSELRQNNPVINATFFAMLWSIRNISWPVNSASDKPEDREAAEYLESCLDDMSFSWDSTLSFVFEPMWEQGFSLVELVYKKRLGKAPPKYCEDPAPSKFNDGLAGWRKFAPRPADSLASGAEWLLDDAGGIQGVQQQTWPDFKLKEIPIERLLLFRTTTAPKNSPEGRSILRGMYIPAYYVQNIQEVEGIGVERDLAGLPIVYLGKGCTLSGANSDYALAKDMVVNVRRDEQEGIVIPHPKMGTAGEGEGFLFELLSTGGRRQFDTDAIIARYNRLIAMTVLANWLFFGMETVGSYALIRRGTDLFGLALSGWAGSVCEVFNRHAVPRLFALSPKFAGLEELPSLSHTEVGVPDLMGVSDYVNKLVGADVLHYDRDLEKYLRGLAGLPELSKEPEPGASAPGALPEGLGPEGPESASKLRDATLTLQRMLVSSEKLLERGLISQEEADAMVAGSVKELREISALPLEKAGKRKPLGKPLPPEEAEAGWEVTEEDIEKIKKDFGKVLRELQ